MPLPSTLTPEQQLVRATGITGSEIAALAGCSRFHQAIDVYAAKVGDAPQDMADDGQPQPHIERGVFLEQGLLNWYAYRTGRRLETPGTLRHPQFPLVVATPDAIAYGAPGEPPRVVECKAPNWRSRGHWGEPGTAEIPSYYIPQVQWELAVSGCKQADVIALLDGDLAVYTVDYDPVLFNALYTVARVFWAKHVEPQRPPAPEASAAYGEYLRRKFPVATAAELPEATPDMLDHIRAYYFASHHQRAWATKEAAAKHTLMDLLGTHKGVCGSWGRIHYRNNKPAPKTNWRAVAEALGAPQDLIAQHTTQPVPGPRVFRAYFTESDSLLHAAASQPSLSSPTAVCLEPATAVPGPVA